jgi:hypothetical protein
MKILRRGASADHGYRSIELKRPSCRWNPTADAFDVSFAEATRDFATQGRHIYYLRIEPSEMAQILKQFAEQALSMETDEFVAVFGDSVPAFLRLQLLASGIRLAA